MKKVGIVRFLGTNCDFDVFNAVKDVGLEPEWLWYEDRFDVARYEGICIPGGFSYGDYLRCGALAAKAAVMQSVREAADRGTPVLGICNGFQILCETQLLPGILVRNEKLRFIDDWVTLTVKSTSGKWPKAFPKKKAKLPIAHGEGRFFAEDDVLKRIFDNDQVWAFYDENPNGSLKDVAGVINEKGNVCALMPHPDRAMFDFQGSTDGRAFFEVFR